MEEFPTPLHLKGKVMEHSGRKLEPWEGRKRPRRYNK
jgi:hypothetical protein